MVFGGALLIVGGTVWGGFVLSILWGWFVVPAFGVEPIGVANAIGLAGIAALLRAKVSSGTSEKKEAVDLWTDSLAQVLGVPGIALCVGWVIHFFM